MPLKDAFDGFDAQEKADTIITDAQRIYLEAMANLTAADEASASRVGLALGILAGRQAAELRIIRVDSMIRPQID